MHASLLAMFQLSITNPSRCSWPKAMTYHILTNYYSYSVAPLYTIKVEKGNIINSKTLSVNIATGIYFKTETT